MIRSLTYVFTALTAMVAWVGCRSVTTDDAVKTTFVLSDTMLNTVTIDTVKMAALPDDSRELPAIPSCAVVLDKTHSFVMVFRDKYNVAAREVKVLKAANGVSYIDTGLVPGEKVLSRNQLQIYQALKSYRHS
ncbi:hypothetical protein MKQ68_08865 [Chitinophaga horti]|uniref:Uncharacterized protein n=1 Tax=Chitinophaga horti TaxID=2920382 RepID=A0ABY6J6A1_9BACT|nr:hypothetical protein [Chitinophaga horti]UYQ95205.1 hypothetical protein MKQ68_08865 [Chitinophaga horti]